MTTLDGVVTRVFYEGKKNVFGKYFGKFASVCYVNCKQLFGTEIIWQ